MKLNKLIIVVFWLILGLVGCVSNSPKVEEIYSVSSYYHTSSLGPRYRFNTNFKINGDLSTEWQIWQYGKLLKTARGNISQQQLEALAKFLNDSRYMKLKSKERDMPMVGCSSYGIDIKTNIGINNFVDNCFTSSPKDIQGIYKIINQYCPEDSYYKNDYIEASCSRL